MSGGLDILAPREEDVIKFLACATHVGTANLDFQMKQYVYKRKPDGKLTVPIKFYLKCMSGKIDFVNYEDAVSRNLNKIFTILGVHIIDLRKTWEKILVAARAIAAIENPADVCVISSRPVGQRAVLKFAYYTGATPIAGRFTPGTFTNQIQVCWIVICQHFGLNPAKPTLL